MLCSIFFSVPSQETLLPNILPNKQLDGPVTCILLYVTWLPQLLWWRPSFSAPPATPPAPPVSGVSKGFFVIFPPNGLNMWGENCSVKNMLKQNLHTYGTFQWPKHHALQQFWRTLVITYAHIVTNIPQWFYAHMNSHQFLKLWTNYPKTNFSENSLILSTIWGGHEYSHPEQICNQHCSGNIQLHDARPSHLISFLSSNDSNVTVFFPELFLSFSQAFKDFLTSGGLAHLSAWMSTAL